MRRKRGAEIVLVIRARREGTAASARPARGGWIGLGHRAALTQREMLRDVMLSAAECDTWLTLHELSQLTRYGEASISAQLRLLRKREFGGYFVEKRLRRGAGTALREHSAVWEYQVRHGMPLRAETRAGKRSRAELRLSETTIRRDDELGARGKRRSPGAKRAPGMTERV